LVQELSQPYTGSGAVLQGRAIHRVQPIYPLYAKTAHIYGKVVVQIAVDERGTVIHARALSGPSELRDAAVAAAVKWRFTPTRLVGKPIRVIGMITFNFTL
jgi:TonB family protein